MNADDLRTVATDIRRKAAASQSSTDPWYDARTLAAIEDGALNPDDCDHIAAWPPALAVATAAILEAVADSAERIATSFPSHFPHALDNICAANVTGYREAEAFVAAWRGES